MAPAFSTDQPLPWFRGETRGCNRYTGLARQPPLPPSSGLGQACTALLSEAGGRSAGFPPHLALTSKPEIGYLQRALATAPARRLGGTLLRAGGGGHDGAVVSCSLRTTRTQRRGVGMKPTSQGTPGQRPGKRRTCPALASSSAQTETATHPAASALQVVPPAPIPEPRPAHLRGPEG